MRLCRRLLEEPGSRPLDALASLRFFASCAKLAKQMGVSRKEAEDRKNARTISCFLGFGDGCPSLLVPQL